MTVVKGCGIYASTDYHFIVNGLRLEIYLNEKARRLKVEKLWNESVKYILEKCK